MADNNNFHGPIHGGMSVGDAKRAVAQAVRDVEQLEEDMRHAQESETILKELCISFGKRVDEIEARIKACFMILGMREAPDREQATETAQASAPIQETEAPGSTDDNDSSDGAGLNQSAEFDDDDTDGEDIETLVGSDYEDDYFQGYSDSDEASVYSSEDDEDEDEDDRPLEPNEDDQSNNGIEERSKDGEEDEDNDDVADSSAGGEPCSSHDIEEDEEFGYPLHRVQANSGHGASLHDGESSEKDDGGRWVRGCYKEHNQQDLEAPGRTNVERTVQVRASLPEALHHVKHQTFERSKLINISEEKENEMNKDEQEEESDDDDSDDNSSFDLDRPISPFELPPPLSPLPPPHPVAHECENANEDDEEADDDIGDEYWEHNAGDDNNNIWIVPVLNHPLPFSPTAPRSSTPPPPYTPTRDTRLFPSHLIDHPLDPSHPLAAATSARIHSDAVHSAHLARIRSDADHIVYLEASNLIQRSIIQTLLPSDGTPAALSEQTEDIMMQRIQDLEAELASREQVINAQAHEITHLMERTDLQDDTIAIQAYQIRSIGEDNAILRMLEAEGREETS